MRQMRLVSSSDASCLSVAVIGAGLGGIAAAYHLKRSGLAFTVFEQSHGPGGTWWDSRYPGCEVDVHSHLYSYSFFRSYDWPRTHNKQPELQRYCQATIDRFDIGAHFEFAKRVDAVRWDDEAELYKLRLETGEERSFNVVVTALGLLNYPKYPQWPGLEGFAGPKFHTARWEHQHDLAGRRIAVIGTGSTSAQVVPAIAPTAGHVYVFQREPGWLLPKGARDFSPEERRRYRRLPALILWNRFRTLQAIAKRMDAYASLESASHRELERMCVRFIEETIDDPVTRAAVTPSYPWGCKRTVIDDNFYRSLNRRNVSLIPRAVAGVTSDAIVDADGVSWPVDVVVMATGFQPTRFFASLEVTGPRGRTIQDIWGDAETFLGITVAGMPNFFMLYGPNTNGAGSICGALERQAEVMARTVRRMKRHGVLVAETRPAAQRLYMRWLGKRLDAADPVWRGGCSNYFYSENGRNVTQLPISALQYWALTRTLPSLGIRC